MFQKLNIFETGENLLKPHMLHSPVADDPLRGFSSTAGTKSIFKIFYDVFSSDKTAALVYTNDIKVLIDIIVRSLTDLSPGDNVSFYQFLDIM